MATWTPLVYAFGSLLTAAKMTQTQANFEAMAQGASGAPRVLGTDNWYRMAGQDGSLTVNSDTTLVSGIYHYTFVQVNSGKTLSVNSGVTLTLMCSSICNIEGIIDLSGNGASGGTSGGAGSDGSTASGAGGGSGNAGVEAGDKGGNAVNWSITISGGLSGVGAGVTGDNGATHPNSRTPFWHFGDTNIRRCGAGGGGGYHTTGGGGGGNGGGELVIASPAVLVDSFGIINVSGIDGGNATISGDGGGGGGGGGRVQIMVSAESYSNVGSINMSGGIGGTGNVDGGDGGIGGTGLTEVIQLT